ncbi:heat stress transcription factor A-9-like [Vigna umbellata]|uniref:heat stress transcription factor A-9-like n=1 Tax=Vigna umbellata TaxID=87088 RepID=UPI001F5E8D65|nr:heat stress transcription factor A-9-like [Vigna umbellata]
MDVSECESLQKVKAKEPNKVGSENGIVLMKEEDVEWGPQPFMKKILKMVEDESSNPIVSWGEGRCSFVIWDSAKFSKTILPNYFKHSNFSSFLRQLNNYGFKKVNPKRWEFACEGFQPGKRHLLKHIVRRGRKNKLCNEQLRGEVEELKKEKNVLALEILKLTQRLRDSQVQLNNFEERLRYVELKQYQMLDFFSRMVQVPGFVEQLVHKIQQKDGVDGADMVMRCKFLGPQYYLSFSNKGTNTSSNFGYYRQQGFEQNGITSFCPVKDDSYISTQGPRTDGYDVSHAYDGVLEELLSENFGEDVNVSVNESNIYLELESLIGSTSGLMG